MKTRNLTSIFAGVLAIVCVLAGLATAGGGNGAGLDRVPVFVGFRQVPGPSEQALVRSHGGVIKYSYTLVPAIAASIPEPAIEGLRRNPNVTIVEPDIEVFAVDLELDNSWGVKRIGAGTVHPTNNGAGVKVAIIDSGVDYTHPDLDGNFGSTKGYDFVNSDNDPMDDNGHGTHCAGIVAAEDNGLGVVGVAPAADLYALKVLNKRGRGYFSDIVAAVQWAVGNDMDVTSNSYGSSGDPGWTVETAFNSAAAVGIINVCAAGNSGAGADTVIYPAKYPSCIAVAATDSSDTRASFSSTGPAVEIAAPGVYIRSTYPDNRYVYMSGTSMACPHVAGVAALAIAAGVTDVRGTLAATADDLGAAGRDPLYGHGLVDADEAAAAPAGPPTADFVGMPTSGTAPLLVYFTDISTGLVTSWFWSFGDGGTSTVRDPSHTYSTAGSYTVSLTVTGPGGSDTAAASKYITVSAPSTPPAPVAGFSASPTSGLAPLSVNFTDLSTGNISAWSWNFGDGSTSSTQNPSHTYTVAGSYTVSLTVTGPGGSNTATASNYIIVTAPPTQDLTMHVADIAMALKKAGPNVNGIATVFVVDADGVPVAGATVYGQWSNATSDSDVGTTDTVGRVTLQSDKIKRPASGTTFTFTVTNVVKSGWTYDPTSDVETEDSAVVP